MEYEEDKSEDMLMQTIGTNNNKKSVCVYMFSAQRSDN